MWKSRGKKDKKINKENMKYTRLWNAHIRDIMLYIILLDKCFNSITNNRFQNST